MLPQVALESRKASATLALEMKLSVLIKRMVVHVDRLLTPHHQSNMCYHELCQAGLQASNWTLIRQNGEPGFVGAGFISTLGLVCTVCTAFAQVGLHSAQLDHSLETLRLLAHLLEIHVELQDIEIVGRLVRE